LLHPAVDLQYTAKIVGMQRTPKFFSETWISVRLLRGLRCYRTVINVVAAVRTEPVRACVAITRQWYMPAAGNKVAGRVWA